MSSPPLASLPEFQREARRIARAKYVQTGVIGLVALIVMGLFAWQLTLQRATLEAQDVTLTHLENVLDDVEEIVADVEVSLGNQRLLIRDNECNVLEHRVTSRDAFRAIIGTLKLLALSTTSRGLNRVGEALEIPPPPQHTLVKRYRKQCADAGGLHRNPFDLRRFERLLGRELNGGHRGRGPKASARAGARAGARGGGTTGAPARSSAAPTHRRQRPQRQRPQARQRPRPHPQQQARKGDGHPGKSNPPGKAKGHRKQRGRG